MANLATKVEPTQSTSALDNDHAHRSNEKDRHLSNKDKRMIQACESMLDNKVADITYPGGKSRDAVALEFEDGSVAIAAVRSDVDRADLEYRVLESLAARGAPVPGVLGYNGKKLLLQEKLIGQRLSQSLHGESPVRVEALLDSALEGLAKCQHAGSDAGLDKELPALGVGKEWINDLVRRPLVIGGYLKERPPRPKVDEIRKLFAVKQLRFIKWDARPGNAMVTVNDRVAWFDWEHSGTRCRLDDVAWLLCDEFTPDNPEMEARLLDRYLDEFADRLSLDEAHRYLKAYGVFHSVVRLGLILSLKKDEKWWDFDYCVERDKVGVTLECATRVTRRAARWADFDVITRPLVPWFENVANKLETL